MLKKAVLFLLFFPTAVFAYVSPGRATGFINDFAGVLSEERRSSLEAKLSQFEKDSENEIAIVLIKSLGEDTVENYAVELFKEWAIGKGNKDNGILLLVAIDDRKMRIEVGYGLEGALTDIQSSSIIRNTLSPAFKRGDYYGGLDSAVDDMVSATKGEYLPIEGRDSSKSQDLDWFSNVFVYGFFIAIYLASIFARSRSWWAGGILGGILGVATSFIFGLFYIGIISLILFIPFGLLLDFIVSRAYQRGNTTGHYPWWIGGGPHGGGGLGGGGFGGFGGGRSGGGGSSGDW